MTAETSHDDKQWDVIIIGAGPAGLAAATVTARAGLKTIVIEKGDKPGTKNVMGGILYTRPTAEVWPEFWKSAPLERPIVEQRMWALTNDGAIKLAFGSEKFLGDTPNAFSVLRVKIDRWLAEQARQAGALIICETKVEEVIRDGDRVTGVLCGRDDGDLHAPVVILAEGVNPQLAVKLGMQRPLKPHHAASAVKEVIGLPEQVINDRFNVPDSSQGVAMELMGDACANMVGMAWIYTNKATLSIGVGTLLAESLESEYTPYDLLTRFKAHPMIAPLLEGGEVLEYMSHLIPEGGYNAMPQLFGNGIMIAGDAAMMVNALHREGSNHAVISGKLAAETAIEAHEKGDFTTRTLNQYRARLEHSAILPDLRKYRNATSFVERHPIFQTYPQLAADAAFEMMNVDGATKRAKQWAILRMALQRRNILGMAWDALDGARSTL